jgi:hypothetical protein
MAAMASPTASAKREVLPGHTIVRPSAVRDNAVIGFTAAGPEPQFDSRGSPAHSPMSAAAAIAAAAKPVTRLACFLFGVPAWPTNSVT